MTFYLVAGQGASTDPAPAGKHLLPKRLRGYPSDTRDVEWQILVSYVRVGGAGPTKGGWSVTL